MEVRMQLDRRCNKSGQREESYSREVVSQAYTQARFVGQGVRSQRLGHPALEPGELRTPCAGCPRSRLWDLGEHELSAAHVLGGLQDVLRPAEIAPIPFIRAKGDDLFSLGREPQIGGNDRKGALLFHLREDLGRDDVDAAKAQRLRLCGSPRQLRLPIAPGSTAAKPGLLVEEQIA